MTFIEIESLTVVRRFARHLAAQFTLPIDRYKSWSILLAETGSFDYSFGPHKGVAGHGDILLCPPDTDLARRSHGLISFVFVEFAVSPDQPAEAGGHFAVSDRERYVSTLKHLWAAENDSNPVRDLRTAHLVCDLLYLCDPLSALSTRPIGDLLVAQIAQNLTDNALGRISLRDIAASAALSPVQLVRRFRAATGQTPRQHVESARLAHAKRLLVDTDYVLEHIADECGYESAFYLNRLFKQRFGCSPSEYRKRNRI